MAYSNISLDKTLTTSLAPNSRLLLRSLPKRTISAKPGIRKRTNCSLWEWPCSKEATMGKDVFWKSDGLIWKCRCTYNGFWCQNVPFEFSELAQRQQYEKACCGKRSLYRKRSEINFCTTTAFQNMPFRIVASARLSVSKTIFQNSGYPSTQHYKKVLFEIKNGCGHFVHVSFLHRLQKVATAAAVRKLEYLSQDVDNRILLILSLCGTSDLTTNTSKSSVTGFRQ